MGLLLGGELLLDGLLTTYASWRWVPFVNVPIGILVAVAALRVVTEPPRLPGPVDVAGAVIGTASIALMVFGLNVRTAARLPAHFLACCGL